jgi:thymidylate kinase
MVTVALIGADGAGKTSVGRRLEESRLSQGPPGDESALLFKYLYMGINPEASNHMLPTTRLVLWVKRYLGKETHVGGPPDPARRKRPPRGALKRAAAGIKASLRTVNQLGEEWFRQLLAWYYQRRGYVVLFDRHFYSDYYAHDISADCSQDSGPDSDEGAGGKSVPRSLSRRIHGFLLDRFYPRPDLVILLDAPADVLFARKSEGTRELIESRRQEYFQLREKVPHFVVVNADQPLDAVTRDVIDVIGAKHREQK